MIDQLKALWKRALSYSKKTWKIEDFPVRLKKQKASEIFESKNSFGEAKPWIAQIINWWTMCGLGDTKEEALEQLKLNFYNYLEYENPPRPGTKAELRYADTSQIDELENTAADFFDKILNIDYYNCFISDMSTIFDFGKDESQTLNKINAVYGLGLKELGDGNIVRILKMIKDKKNNL